MVHRDRPALSRKVAILVPRPVGELDPGLGSCPLHQLGRVEGSRVRIVQLGLGSEPVLVTDLGLGGVEERGGRSVPGEDDTRIDGTLGCGGAGRGGARRGSARAGGREQATPPFGAAPRAALNSATTSSRSLVLSPGPPLNFDVGFVPRRNSTQSPRPSPSESGSSGFVPISCSWSATSPSASGSSAVGTCRGSRPPFGRRWAY